MQKTRLPSHPPTNPRANTSVALVLLKQELSRPSVNVLHCANSHEINIKQIGRQKMESIYSHNSNALITMQMEKKMDNGLKKNVLRGEAIFV